MISSYCSKTGIQVVQHLDYLMHAISMVKYNFPLLLHIIDFGLGIECELEGELQPWILTNPVEGNPWHIWASGAHVYAMPIWLYCNDMSGN
jgi:hypothetical protein